MFSEYGRGTTTYDMCKARQEELIRAKQKNASRPRLIGQVWKKVVCTLENAGSRLIERRLGNLNVSQGEVTRR